MQTAWPDVTMLENSLVPAISQLRSALDAKWPNRYITTVFGNGYRFVDPTGVSPRLSTGF